MRPRRRPGCRPWSPPSPRSGSWPGSARALYGAGAGLTAGFALATSLLTFAYGRAASMDALVASPITIATGLIGLRMLGLVGARAILVAHAFMGLAMLAKGPLGFVVPGLVVLAYLVATKDWRPLKEILHPLGILVFLVVAAPWYVAITLDQGRHFIDVFILDHNLQRLTSEVHRHPGPLYYYLPVLLVGMFPWSGLILPAIGALSPRRFRVDLFVLLWLLAPLAFFSLAGSKLPGYILPCGPAPRPADRTWSGRAEDWRAPLRARGPRGRTSRPGTGCRRRHGAAARAPARGHGLGGCDPRRSPRAGHGRSCSPGWSAAARLARSR